MQNVYTKNNKNLKLNFLYVIFFPAEEYVFVMM